MPRDTVDQCLTILIVDDEGSIRELLQLMLHGAGHAVHLACDGRAALTFLEAHGPVDIVLSDINMPRMDGLELLAEIRATWPDLPVLLTSGRPPPYPINHFLAKPFRWKTLTSAITTVIGDQKRGVKRCT